MMELPFVWIGLLVLFAIAEGLTAGLVSIWFCIGSLAALITTFLTNNLLIQILVFAVVSLIAMALIRPMAKKYFTPKHEATNADRFIGREAVVIVPIDPVNGTGQVKADGKVWSALCEADGVIPAGARVRILEIRGVRLMVEPIPETN